MAESPVRVCHPRELAGVLTTPRPFFVQSSGVQPHTGTGEFRARPSAEGEDMKIAIFYQGTADAMGSAISSRRARLPIRGRSVSSPPRRSSL